MSFTLLLLHILECDSTDVKSPSGTQLFPCCSWLETFPKCTWKPKSCSPPCSLSHVRTRMTWWQVFFSQSVANCDGVLTLRSSQLITPAGSHARAELSTLLSLAASTVRRSKKKGQEEMYSNREKFRFRPCTWKSHI